MSVESTCNFAIALVLDCLVHWIVCVCSDWFIVLSVSVVIGQSDFINKHFPYLELSTGPFNRFMLKNINLTLTAHLRFHFAFVSFVPL